MYPLMALDIPFINFDLSSTYFFEPNLNPQTQPPSPFSNMAKGDLCYFL